MLTKTRNSGVTLKLAEAEDQAVVDVIAELDSAPTLRGRALIAFVDGWPVAALSLDDGRVVANPFAPSAEAVVLLRLRARQLHSEPGRRPRLRLVPRRLRLA
ncbi:MAG TPA: hypothetical protein VGH45_03595 [Solirubrobacteraceae bacterium]|jgi:hypothetical protein